MSDLQKTSGSPNWVLYLFPRGKHAKLCCHLPDCSLSQELPGRLAQVIVLLQEASDEDVGLPSELKGIRHAEELARAFEEDLRVDPPKTSTITTYLYKLNLILTEPAATGESFPALIAREKNMGARLLHPVEICHVGRRPRPSPAA